MRRKRKSPFLKRRAVVAFIVAILLGLNFLISEFSDKPIISFEDIPEYSGELYIEINGGVPYFENESTDTEYEIYYELDNYGRASGALACLGRSTMPKDDEKRGSISAITPSGWHTAKYDNVSGGYLYNRSHLIGWQLSAENANEKNLITGTRYFNATGMLEFENMVADYIEETGLSVLYRVTPVYRGEELVARGVLIEAQSAADGGEDLQFCVFVYNVQPGIVIDYLTGESRLE